MQKLDKDANTKWFTWNGLRETGTLLAISPEHNSNKAVSALLIKFEVYYIHKQLIILATTLSSSCGVVKLFRPLVVVSSSCRIVKYCRRIVRRRVVASLNCRVVK